MKLFTLSMVFGLVAAVEGNQVRLSANADNAALLEEEQDGEAIADRNP